MKKAMPKTKYNYDEYQAKLNILAEHAVTHFADLADALGLGLRKQGDQYVGNCPLHDGSNSRKFIFYTDNPLGNFYCPTRECHSQYSNNVIGFVRGVLTGNNGGELVPFAEVIKFLSGLFGIDLSTIKIDAEELEKQNFVKSMAGVGQGALDEGVSADEFGHDLIIPSPYFSSRGISPEILDALGVGDCDSPGSPFYKRAVVPVFSANGKMVVGATARSIYIECGRCGGFHGKNKSCVYYAKWLNQGTFAGHYLYNFHVAKRDVKKTKVAVIVEGQMDAWRLNELGIYNVVGVFGAKLTQQQSALLESLGTMGLVVITDSDEAGQSCAKRIINNFSRLYHITTVKPSAKDLGEMLTKDIVDFVVPAIKKAEERYA